MAALDSLEKKDISSCKGMNTPPPGVGEVFGATMVLLANIIPSVPVQKSGKVKPPSCSLRNCSLPKDPSRCTETLLPTQLFLAHFTTDPMKPPFSPHYQY